MGDPDGVDCDSQFYGRRGEGAGWGVGGFGGCEEGVGGEESGVEV